MDDRLTYLDTYVLQKDMRIRMLANMNAQKGQTRFEIYFDKINDCLVLKKEKDDPQKGNH